MDDIYICTNGDDLAGRVSVVFGSLVGEWDGMLEFGICTYLIYQRRWVGRSGSGSGGSIAWFGCLEIDIDIVGAIPSFGVRVPVCFFGNTTVTGTHARRWDRKS